MNILLVVFSSVAANIIVMAYGHYSSQLSSWRALLLMPVLWFLPIYFINVFVSSVFFTGTRSGLTTPTIFLMHIGIYMLVLYLSNLLVWKTPFHPMQLVGAVSILVGIILVVAYRS